ncbi:hypothetical protein LWI28_021556 [Acer negundo]|uniref:Uncharacterized protein n=1 Tax=Acer negundo TaxID=4023 RepID=A0AAD5IS12_ACENE|nr:hypothetical protein LWI28_021556 [Acer negundo]KAK4844983.1 hypothetical protein QYF36_026724 [Acer negundo]
MVAISLYRGNLHRVPDVPRRWLMPTPKISLKDFKTLLCRRNRALSRVRSTAPAEITVNPNPNPKPNSNSKPQPEPEKPSLPPPQPQSESKKADDGEVKDDNAKIEDANCLVKRVAEASVSPEKAVCSEDVDGRLQAVKVEEEQTEPMNPKQTSEKVEMLDEKEKRKKEVEERLQTLNAKKHDLVQALKQILKAEEELKRRSVQGMATRTPGPLQVDTTNDSGLMTRLANTPRTGSEANLGGDVEGVENEDASNQNTQSRHMLRMSSMSPSSESPLRRPAFFQHNVVPHPSRASLGAIGSPSRFAPTSHQGHPGNLPAVSVSGTNYIASSPSPAASGGTSVFREARQPSPWN